jgi:alkaline phosphatase D
MKRMTLLMTVVINTLMGASVLANASGPYQATGIKIGEVTSNTAIIWTRLTEAPYRVGSEGGFPDIQYADPETGEIKSTGSKRPKELRPVVQFPSERGVNALEGAAPGTPGEVRVLYRESGVGQADWRITDWTNVDPDRDFTHQFILTELTSNVQYDIRVDSRSGEDSGQTVVGQFQTAANPDQAARVLFTVSTGQRYGEQEQESGYKIYPEMLKLDPDFFVHTGDIVYYDREAKTIPLARWHWQRTYSLLTNVDFHRQVASYFIKDDHDTWQNDCWPSMESLYMGDFTFEQGVEIFTEQVPMGFFDADATFNDGGGNNKTWRTARWGTDLQIWMVEGRDYRSPNTMEDGPEKTIWGAEQMDWFMNSFSESDAAYRILISPTPIVGPDRPSKNDNHANSGFQYEGRAIREFLAGQENAFTICGDRHWQYVSNDPQTGLQEFSCGPATDQHAGGFSEEDRNAMHQYLNIKGGFLSVEVDRLDNTPTIFFRHHGVDGDIYNTVQYSCDSEVSEF